MRQAEIHKYMIRNAADQGDFTEMRLMEVAVLDQLCHDDNYPAIIVVASDGRVRSGYHSIAARCWRPYRVQGENVCSDQLHLSYFILKIDFDAAVQHGQQLAIETVRLFCINIINCIPR